MGKNGENEAKDVQRSSKIFKKFRMMEVKFETGRKMNVRSRSPASWQKNMDVSRIRCSSEGWWHGGSAQVIPP